MELLSVRPGVDEARGSPGRNRNRGARGGAAALARLGGASPWLLLCRGRRGLARSACSLRLLKQYAPIVSAISRLAAGCGADWPRLAVSSPARSVRHASATPRPGAGRSRGQCLAIAAVPYLPCRGGRGRRRGDATCLPDQRRPSSVPAIRAHWPKHGVGEL